MSADILHGVEGTDCAELELLGKAHDLLRKMECYFDNTTIELNSHDQWVEVGFQDGILNSVLVKYADPQNEARRAKHFLTRDENGSFITTVLEHETTQNDASVEQYEQKTSTACDFEYFSKYLSGVKFFHAGELQPTVIPTCERSSTDTFKKHGMAIVHSFIARMRPIS